MRIDFSFLLAIDVSFNVEQGTRALRVKHKPAWAAYCDRTIEVVDGIVAG